MSTEGTKLDFGFMLTAKKGLRQDLLKLRKKWDIPENGINDNEGAEKWWNEIVRKSDDYKGRNDSEIAINAFGNDIREIMKKYDIHASYHDVVRGYLLYYSAGIFSQPHNTSISIDYKDFKAVGMKINIFPHTTMKDIQKLWPLVEIQKERMWGIKRGSKKKKMTNEKTNKRVMELSNAGQSDKEIAKIIKQETGHTSLTYADVAKIKYRMKK
ncbi:hypothetical protein KJ662_03350 [Patescibacteria group bacterium]|nr:hypothetical protein [Patescibacteria group bacterium]